MCHIARARLAEYMVCYGMANETPQIGGIEIKLLGKIDVADLLIYRYRFSDFEVGYRSER
jgi:hypothetical protein